MSSSDDRRGTPDNTPATGANTAGPDDVVEHYKTLVGQIEIALPHRGCRVIMLSGSAPGEGTTEITIGLGLVLARCMGRKTAIIDSNVRHPDMHARFGTSEIGLGEYLSREVPLDKALANTIVPNMYIMPAGRRLASLAAVSKEQIADFVADLREKFEYVLIDAAPVGTYPDCAVLCDKVDSVILVVKHGGTRREVVRRTKDIITKAGGKILGVVLNRRTFPIPEFLYRRL
ncbi:MAG: CpsD/CapB family tyrosine-protein kinase [bacterium]